MQSARFSASRYRMRRRSSTRDLDDDFHDPSVTSSRPSTQDSKRSSYSRLSTDSGEGSLEDFSRRNSSPVFFGDGLLRRHTAPIKKSFSPTPDDQETRPNTVHAWDVISTRCSLSRYPPLPAIGSQQQRMGQYDLDRPVPVRRQCFMGPLDVDCDQKDEHSVVNDCDKDDLNDIRAYSYDSSSVHSYRDDPSAVHSYRDDPSALHSYRDDPSAVLRYRDDPSVLSSCKDDPNAVLRYRDDPSALHSYRDDSRAIHSDKDDCGDVPDINDNDCESSVSRPVFSLTIDSDVDSDFEDESGIATQGESDIEDSDSKPRRPIIRSATFTIEKERPDIHGPYLSIAVRLPSGDRVAKRFDCKETLQNVCDFAFQGMQDPRANRWSLVTTDFPKRIFKDLAMTLKEADIDDKSLLYLQTWDESDSD